MLDPTHRHTTECHHCDPPCRSYMMSQETTAPPQLDVQNSWKDGGLFPSPASMSPVFVVGTTGASSDEAMSAEATSIAAGMAVLGQVKHFHSFIRSVCRGLFHVHVESVAERCVVRCVCDCHIKPTRVPLRACPPAFILILYLILYLILACLPSRVLPSHSMRTQPCTCASLSTSLEQLRKQGRNDSSTSSSKNASAGDAPPLPPNAPQSPGGTRPARA